MIKLSRFQSFSIYYQVFEALSESRPKGSIRNNICMIGVCVQNNTKQYFSLFLLYIRFKK